MKKTVGKLAVLAVTLEVVMGGCINPFFKAPYEPESGDTTPPAFSSAAVNGTDLFITLSETATGTPLAPDFTVGGIAGNPAVSSAAVSGTTIALTLASAASNGETVTVSYTQNSDAVKHIKDAAGNTLAGFSGKPVTNNTGVPKTVTTVGAQSGALTSGTAGSAAFAVATGGISGSAAVSLSWFSDAAGTLDASGPAGVTVSTPVTVAGSPTDIMLNTTAATPGGAYYFRVTIDGVTSVGVGTVTVVSADRTAGLYVGSSTVPEPGVTGLVAGLTWIQSNQVNGESYRIVLDVGETVGHQTLTTDVATGITIILEGVGAERIIQLSSTGSLFVVAEKITLVLDKYITLQGKSGNSDSLIRVNMGGNLEMREDAKVTRNTFSSASSINGGGVYVSNGSTFTMHDSASVSGNTVTTSSLSSTDHSNGGGVYVSNGSTFTMHDSASVSGNTVTTSSLSSPGGSLMPRKGVIGV